jgi:F0F1-type ATP synthase membrane subunit b/b'
LLSVDATAFVILAIVFALVFVLKNHLFEPLARAMETRKATLERAANAWTDAEQTIDGARRRLDEAVKQTRNEGYEQLDKTRGEAQKKARAELDDSRETAQQQIADAQRRLKEETDRAVKSLETEADGLARSIASRILGRDVA